MSDNSWMPNAGDDREGIGRARQAAEELFKPKRQTTANAATANNVLPDGDQPRRQPRIFTISRAMPPNAVPADTPTQSRPKRRKAAPKREIREIPASQFGRVRTLASYGMTRAEVAQLYGVSLDEVERIIKGTI